MCMQIPLFRFFEEAEEGGREGSKAWSGAGCSLEYVPSCPAG